MDAQENGRDMLLRAFDLGITTLSRSYKNLHHSCVKGAGG